MTTPTGTHLVSNNSFSLLPPNETTQNNFEQQNKENCIQAEDKRARLDRLIDELSNRKDNDNSGLSTLSMISNQQKQIVLSMLNGSTVNREQQIGLALQSAIEAYTEELRKYEGYTNGGLGAYNDMVDKMFDSMLEGINENKDDMNFWIDLFQLILLDLMANKEQYGSEMVDWYNKNQGHISHLLEALGSGSHALHEFDYNSPEKMAKWASKLLTELNELNNEGAIPKNSVAANALSKFEEFGITPEKFEKDIIDGWDKDAFWSESSRTISPMLRLSLLSALYNKGETVTPEMIDVIMSGNTKDIDKLFSDKFNQKSLDWFMENDKRWQLHDFKGHKQMDWIGDGIDISALNDLYSKFPARELTEDELSEVNRIGDKIKMIQQTLKMWIQLCSDTGLSIARNI